MLRGQKPNFSGLSSGSRISRECWSLVGKITLRTSFPRNGSHSSARMKTNAFAGPGPGSPPDGSGSAVEDVSGGRSDIVTSPRLVGSLSRCQAPHNAHRTSVSAAPNQLVPRQASRRRARGSSRATPIPQIASVGDASTRVVPLVSRRRARRSGFRENLAIVPRNTMPRATDRQKSGRKPATCRPRAFCRAGSGSARMACAVVSSRNSRALRQCIHCSPQPKAAPSMIMGLG